MNVSGPAVASAWKTFLKDLEPNERRRAKLVLLHDELESPLGKIKLKTGGSAKGHNGLKSCATNIGAMAFTRIGVGIGRPASRESSVVSDYVLRKMNPGELAKIEQCAPELGSILLKVTEVA